MDPFETTLRDGGRVLLRPLRPDDREKLREGFDRLTPQARVFRFGRELAELDDDMLDELMAVDRQDHVAWVAVDADDPDHGLGVARFIREPYETWAAEAAVTVAEGERGRGVGTILLVTLAHVAREVGITQFRNYVLPDNDAMVEVMAHLGGHVRIEGKVLRIDLPLVDDRLDERPVHDVVRAVARGRGGVS